MRPTDWFARLLALLAVVVIGGGLLGCGDDRPEPRSTREARERPADDAQLAPVARISSTDAWQDLIAQRPSAVTLRAGRLFIDLGHPSARKHLQLAAGGSPFLLAQDVDDRRAAILVGTTGALDIPLDGELAPALHPDTPWQPAPGHEADPAPDPIPPPTTGLAMAITLRGMAPDQSVTVLWEERPLANLRVSDQWERRTLSLPHDLVVTGENRLRLHFRTLAPLTRPGAAGTDEEAEPAQVSAAIESVEVGTLAAIKSGPLERGRNFTIRASAGETEFEVPAGVALAYYLVPPRRSRLQIEVSGRGALSVLASTDEDHREGRKPAELVQQPLRATGRSVAVDLSGYAEIPTRLEIRVTSTREQNPGDPPAGAVFEAIDIVANRSIPLDRRDRQVRDVYVIALEGARPDDLFEPQRRGPALPNIERFVEHALVFDRAYALGPAAVPSHAGLLSSMVPPAHLTVLGSFVAESQTMLPELLGRAGYFNSSVSANSDFDDQRGLTQGFADHRILEHSNTRGNDASKIVLAMLEEIERRPSPRFVYGVLNDAQAPYDPPSELLTDVVVPIDAPAQHRTHMWIGRVRTGKVVPDATQLAYVRRLYRGELQVIDQALGVLLDALEERGELDQAVVVIVGIHGEEFLEHGSAGHGHSLYEESIRVPLAIRAPALLAPGRVEVPVDLLDLAPTLTDLLGVEYDPRWQGESLVPLLDDPQPPPRLIVSYVGDGSRAAIIGDHKLVLGPGRGREAQHFYELAGDPGELDDRIAEGGVALRMVRTAVAWELPEQPGWKRARWGTGANLLPAFALDHGL
ncbi:sulfatase [Nannocystaceae bacterium ST9]